VRRDGDLPSAVILTTLNHGSCFNTTRRIHEFGINMQVLCEIQSFCILAEKKMLENSAVFESSGILKHSATTLAGGLMIVSLCCLACY
jgi:uncharacterized membrane protein YjjP (DUF1212 family)